MLAECDAMNKCKREGADEPAEGGEGAKEPQRRKRSNSEPAGDTGTDPKRVALNRLFGRVCSTNLNERNRILDDDDDYVSEEELEYSDENDDPLLDTVPVNMDPEQLGFLVCAQETLRFLHRRGLSIEHPVFARLRSQFLRSLSEMGMA